MNVAALVYSLRELHRSVCSRVASLDESVTALSPDEWPSGLWTVSWTSAMHSLVYADRILHQRELQLLDLITERQNEALVSETAAIYRAKYTYFTTDLWHAHALRRFADSFEALLVQIADGCEAGVVDDDLVTDAATLLLRSTALLSVVDGDLHTKEHSLVLRLDEAITHALCANDAVRHKADAYNTSAEEWRQRLNYDDDLRSYKNSALTDDTAEVYSIQAALTDIITTG